MRYGPSSNRSTRSAAPVIDPLLRQMFPAPYGAEEQPAAVLLVGSTWNTPDVVRATVPWRTTVEPGITVKAP